MKKARMGISGALAGAVNGLFGGGGGMVLAPLLESWCRVEENKKLQFELDQEVEWRNRTDNG